MSSRHLVPRLALLLTLLVPLLVRAAAGQAITQQAYVKASNTGAGDVFGLDVALSGDTLAVGAQFEDSSSTGVGGEQGDNGSINSGAVYVFVDNGGWTQQAYIKASNTDESDAFGSALALDGDTLVVAARGEDSGAVGIDGDQDDDGALSAGAVYVFVRSGTTWTQQAYIKASNTEVGDRFSIVALDGDTLAVGAAGEDSAATGIDGSQADGANAAGAVYVFVRSGTTWTQQAYIKASNTGANDGFGGSLSLDGDTLVVGASGEDSSATGVDGEQDNDDAPDSGAAYVFVRSGSTWSQQAYLKASNAEEEDRFAVSVAVDGDTILVGSHLEASAATGVDGDQDDNSAPGAGAVYVFERDGSTWSQQAYLKGSNAGADDSFGLSLAIAGDRALVAADLESSAAVGVGGDQADDSANQAGAAYLFQRAGGHWYQQAYLKASNTDALDHFGDAVALSDLRAVVGAAGEASAATGIGGDGTDDSADQAGAVYLFDSSRWTDTGGGTRGVAGEPDLTLSGPLTAASQVDLELVDGPPSALALLFIAFESAPTAFLGGTLHAFPFDVLVVTGTDPTGALAGSALFPGAASGQGLWFQVGLADATVPLHGASLSNGVVGVVP